ncbi:Lrp/AsnC family transcriptional regulator [Lutimaribacter saemankumensis]|uniref:Lrp/AsnC family transcriptional regulator n=2 Tax=Lutimaribacter saemankumensis TaxID=490829 RepID=A0A1G8K9X1_9RHOB|nr:Lrp/AsnC family transcriptional regulator [Lutimaribacter saemankumensis]
MTIFIGVTASRHEISWLNQFRELIEEIPEITEAYRLTGTVDYILKVVVPDVATYDRVYKQMIERLEFNQINSMISMEELKFTTAIPTSYL